MRIWRASETVSQDIGNFCIAVTVSTGFGETDFYIVIAVLVHPHGRQTEGTFQFACGTGVIFGAGTDHGRKIAPDLCEDNFAARFENLFGYFVRPFTER